MKKIKIEFEVTDEQYKDYEKYVDDFSNNLNELSIQNVDIFEEEVERLIKCPFCDFESEECDFPDLFVSDFNNTKGIITQVDLLEELQGKGYNIVTCGNCGGTFIIKKQM